MPESIAAIPGATVSPTAINPLDLYAVPSPGVDNNTAIDQEAFLKLLVAQLKYQNPLEPTSNEEFISITAQFTTVERLNELAEQGRSRTSNEALNTAGALVGRTVSFLDALGRMVQTTVDQAAVIGDDVQLLTADGPISLDQIVAIGARGGETPSNTPPTAVTPSTTSTITPTTVSPSTDTSSSDTQSPAESSPTTTSSQEATIQ